ncbi:MAG: hypothetical protein M3040_08945 [Bacteroidota bacterium]|nr:hypothetical protein [Bacteroidota bacterium]
MKTIKTRVLTIAAIVVAIKEKTDLLIIRVTSLKTYATVEAVIIGMV